MQAAPESFQIDASALCQPRPGRSAGIERAGHDVPVRVPRPRGAQTAGLAQLPPAPGTAPWCADECSAARSPGRTSPAAPGRSAHAASRPRYVRPVQRLRPTGHRAATNPGPRCPPKPRSRPSPHRPSRPRTPSHTIAAPCLPAPPPRSAPPDPSSLQRGHQVILLTRGHALGGQEREQPHPGLGTRPLRPTLAAQRGIGSGRFVATGHLRSFLSEFRGGSPARGGVLYFYQRYMLHQFDAATTLKLPRTSDPHWNPKCSATPRPRNPDAEAACWPAGWALEKHDSTQRGRLRAGPRRQTGRPTMA